MKAQVTLRKGYIAHFQFKKDEYGKNYKTFDSKLESLVKLLQLHMDRYLSAESDQSWNNSWADTETIYLQVPVNEEHGRVEVPGIGDIETIYVEYPDSVLADPPQPPEHSEDEDDDGPDEDDDGEDGKIPSSEFYNWPKA